MNNRTAETFDKLAYTYEFDIEDSSPYNTLYERPAMMSQLPEDLSGMKVLDAGCSAGWYAEQLVNRGAEVTGIDISYEMVQAAKRKLGNRATLFQHDLSKTLPFKEDTFDIVNSSLTIHYIKDWSQLFSEIKRVLKPGGVFLFSIQHPFTDYLIFKHKDYFDIEWVSGTWKKPNITIDVGFYRRPLQEMISVTNKYFQLEDLIEPQPHPDMETDYPKTYQKLMTNPAFLIIKAKSP